MMNQAASATRRPAGSTATTGCCPMFNTPFFVNTFTPQAAPLIPPPPPAAGHCFLGTQAPQLQLSSNQQPVQQQQQQSAAAVLPLQQQPLISHQHQPQLQQQQSSEAPLNASNNIHQQQQRQQAPQQQPQPPRLQDLPNNYSTSAPMTASGLSLQQLLASRHSASNCMALAAALASASFPHFQQLQQAQQQQQQQLHQSSTPINRSTSTSNTTNPVPQPPPSLSANTSVSNQVPLLNFNSYNSAQPFLSSQAPHPAPVAPAAAHLSTHPNTHLGALNNVNTNTTTQATNLGNQSTLPQGLPTMTNTNSNLTLEQNQQQQHRQPLTSASMNSASNQPTNYRVNAQAPINMPPATHPIQQLRQVTRNILNDEALNSLLNDQFQAILLNQLFANHQFTPSVAVPAPAQQQAQVPLNSNRPLQQQQQQQQQQSTLDQAPVVVSPNQQVTARSVSQQPPSTQEPASEQQQAFQPTRLTQNPVTDAYVPSGTTNNTAPSGAYQAHQQQHLGPINHQHLQHQPTAPESSVPQFQAQQPLQQQAPPPLQQQHQRLQQQQQQQQQQPQPIHQMPFYSFPQMEQALALLTNPQVANNIFSHVFNIYFQNGMRTEPHHTHHHHHAPHHFHHHLHGAHHHHGPNGPANGQDVTMPLDSLAISESKPRGLNRAEIDSLTPYIHINEKDSRTCVICLSKFELKSKIRPLPCNHAFHAKCVDKWLRANRTCPICRRDALKTYGAKIKRV